MKLSEGAAAGGIYEFGDFLLDAGKRLVRRRHGPLVPLTPKVFDTLLYLVQHCGMVVEKDRLMAAVWPDAIVEENNLNQHISALRRVLGESPGSHRFIVTVPGRGYRFVADVTVHDRAVERSPTSGATADDALEQIAGKQSAVAMQPAKSPVRRIVIGVVAILALMGAFVFFRGRGILTPPPAPSASVPPTSIPQKSIAVLPFENLSRDAENAYFADGVQDEILTRLAKLADLKVISRMSVMPYKNNENNARRNLPEIAQQLGVEHLLEGSVQRAGNRVRVNAQLIATRSGAHEWAETYDRELADVFAIQSEIAQSIAAQLQAKISPREQAALTAPPTTDLVANALYQQAKAIEAKEFIGSEKLLEAVRLAEQAVARDPQFVSAFCLLGRLHTSLFYGSNDHTPAHRESAEAALQNARRLQPESGEVHLAWAYYSYYGFLDYDRARAELELARRTLPNSAELYYLTALLDRRQARWTEATRNAERAVELDPRNTAYLMLTGGIYEQQHSYSDGRRLYNRALAIEPHNLVARILRARAPFYQIADLRPLRAELSAILAEEPGNAQKVAENLLRCALAERDSAAAARALAVIPATGMGGPYTAVVYPREWFAGVVARTFDDPAAAHTAFTTARSAAERFVLAQTQNAQGWSLLARIDAALGRKEDAIREGRHACELVPLSKDAFEGTGLIVDLAVVYAWVGEKDLALEELATAGERAWLVHYGGLKLDPQWDSLRGDARFEQLVADLAPKN